MFLPLILASTSPYRRALLQRLGIAFECVSPGVEEDHLAGESPQARALRLAQAKAQAVSVKYPQAVVIGSDQVAACGDAVLDKPGDATRARAQLAALSGTVAHFYTACVVMAPGIKEGAGALPHLDITTVHVRSLSVAEIARYVEREQPYDCAGSFKVEGAGIALFSRIESEDPTGLIGLPLIFVAQALRQCGFLVP